MIRLSRAVALSFSLAATALSGCGDDDAAPRSTTTAVDPAADAGLASRIELEPPGELDGAARAQWLVGRDTVAQTGCLACHTIGTSGNASPGPDLARVGDRLTAARIAATLRDPYAPMPSYARFAERRPETFDALVAFLVTLR